MSAIAYVCVVSDFTLPTLQACLDIRPAHTVLIASDIFMPQALRLQTQLREKLTEGQTYVFSKDSTGHSLDGDDVCANAQWLEQHLCPRLRDWQAQDLQVVVNITGGTKAMTLALSNCYPWQRIDYQPINKPMQSVQVKPRDTGRSCFSAVSIDGSASVHIGPRDVARLHNWQVREEASNPLCGSPDAGGLTQLIWDAQRQNDRGLQALFSGLERIWVRERAQHQQPNVTVAWHDFFPPSGTDSPEQVQSWVQRLSALAPTLLHADNSGITLPGNRPKNEGKHLRDWISGDWLEQLAGDWLVQGGIAPDAMARNLVASPDSTQRSDSNREADLLIHQHNVTSLVEIKAGLPPGKSPSEMENQLSSLGARFGKTRKALLLGPQLHRDLCHQRRIEALWYRCRASGVTLLLEKIHLIAFVQGDSPWKNAASQDGSPPKELMRHGR